MLGRRPAQTSGPASGARSPEPSPIEPAAIHLGRFRATDGSAGAPVALDCDRPHAALVVGKRGAGKSNTLSVLAEGLATADGVAPIVIDPMGEFGDLGAAVPASVIADPRVAPSALSPRAWCSLLSLDPTGPAGSLVWAAAERAETLSGMCAVVERTGDRRPQDGHATETPGDAAPASDDAGGSASIAEPGTRATPGAPSAATAAARRAAANHLRRAATWGVFDPDGLDPAALRSTAVTVLDCSSSRAAGPAVLAAVADGLYRDCAGSDAGRLPWLLVDEAAALLDDVSRAPVERLLTRGRTPGVSLVLATQRPGALPPVAVSQSDVLVSHRLTAAADVDALERARPVTLRGTIRDRLPDRPGTALVVDEATDRAVTIRVRERESPHGGETPRARERIERRAAGTAPL